MDKIKFRLMKNMLIIIFLPLLFLVIGCEKDLTKEPPFISENVVFEDENLVESYMAELYESSQFQVAYGQDMAMYAAAAAENICFANWQVPNDTYRRIYSAETGPGPLDDWNYELIRNINYLLENIGDSESLDQDYITAKIAEARFLRAWEYFNMAKRWGGVPIITTVQSPDTPKEELYVPRNSEEEVYNFINDELNAILPVYNDAKTGNNGRVDKYAVLMLLSRSNLYAASVARNGTLGPNGLTGISAGNANSYFQMSYDASKDIVDSGMFRLINDNADKVSNYASIFLNEGNDEIILAEIFEPFIKGHALDHRAHPQGFGSSWNSNFPVIYDFVELFDFVDGSSGKIDRSLLNESNEWDIDEFFGNRDPRFRASVFYPESPFQGKKVYFHYKTIYDGGTMESDDTGATFTTVNGEEWPGASPPRNRRNTSLLLRKRVNENDLVPQDASSGQDYVIFRYAETLLNMAEAAFYLGRTDEALNLINQIRDRAGMPLRTEITEDYIRQERQVELSFEDHRYWDLIRWRVAPEVLSVRTKGLEFAYNLDTDKYIITLKDAENAIRVFEPKRVYLPFSLDRLASNPNLMQNPEY